MGKYNEARKESIKAWQARNRVHVREGQLRNRQTCQEKIFKILGKVCVACGFTDKRALQVDHINGDGYKERGNIHKRLKLIQLNPTAYQILCANCNWIKRVVNGEYRQQCAIG